MLRKIDTKLNNLNFTLKILAYLGICFFSLQAAHCHIHVAALVAEYLKKRGRFLFLYIIIVTIIIIFTSEGFVVSTFRQTLRLTTLKIYY